MARQSFIRVGDVLRDALIEDIDAIDWDESTRDQAAKVKASLQGAAPYRGGYLVDVEAWTRGDVDFLRMEVDSVEEDEGHSFMSHGVRLGNTRIGRQILALRTKLDDL